MKRPALIAAAAVTALLAAFMPALPATADAGSVTAKAKWVNNTVTLLYNWDGSADTLSLKVGSATVSTTSAAQNDRVLTATRRSGKSVTVSAVEETCTTTSPDPVDPPVTDPTEPVAAPADDVTTCTENTVWTQKVTRHIVKRKAGQISAVTLLSHLKVTSEKRSSSYARSKFKLWVDANHDGENTRAEVLKAESKRRVAENSHHTVTTGKWVSPYDGKTYTGASKLDIDHLVPLEEAWTSGAYSWSAKKRTAYANDIAFGPTLVAVSLHENRSKGDEEPNAYLPPKTSYVCTYVRNWIAVKYRWGLSVDSAEKAALRLDLTSYCVNPNVTKPGKPNLTALVGVPRSTGGGSHSGGGSSTAPAGATAICRDGTYSYSQHHSGTCSHHGGVDHWL